MAEEQENIPIEITIQSSSTPSVASVAAASLAVIPENVSIEQTVENIKNPNQRTIRRPKAKAHRSATAQPAGAADTGIRSDPKSTVERMKRELEEGRRRLKPEEINNPFSKEFNKLLLKKELLEREMTIHDIGILPSDNDSDSPDNKIDAAATAAATAAALTGLYPTLNDPNFNTKIALRKEFF